MSTIHSPIQVAQTESTGFHKTSDSGKLADHQQVCFIVLPCISDPVVSVRVLDLRSSRALVHISPEELCCVYIFCYVEPSQFDYNMYLVVSLSGSSLTITCRHINKNMLTYESGLERLTRDRVGRGFEPHRCHCIVS